MQLGQVKNIKHQEKLDFKSIYKQLEMMATSIAVLAVCLLQLVHCQSGPGCDANYPNSGGLPIDGNVEVVDNLLSLVDGLNATREIMVCRCIKNTVLLLKVQCH